MVKEDGGSNNPDRRPVMASISIRKLADTIFGTHGGIVLQLNGQFSWRVKEVI
jgi:hypothetical protein